MLHSLTVLGLGPSLFKLFCLDLDSNFLFLILDFSHLDLSHFVHLLEILDNLVNRVVLILKSGQAFAQLGFLIAELADESLSVMNLPLNFLTGCLSIDLVLPHPFNFLTDLANLLVEPG